MLITPLKCPGFYRTKVDRIVTIIIAVFISITSICTFVSKFRNDLRAGKNSSVNQSCKGVFETKKLDDRS